MRRYRLEQGKLHEHDDGEWYRADDVDAVIDMLTAITKPNHLGRVTSAERCVREVIREHRGGES